MTTVCEVCYSTKRTEYLDIHDSEPVILPIISKHLPCVMLDGIDHPQICVDCWSTLESFERFYLSVEELHQPQPDSSDEDERDEIVTVHEADCNDTAELEVSEVAYETEQLDNATSGPIHVTNTQMHSTASSPEDEAEEREIIDFYGPLICTICEMDHIEVQYQSYALLKRHQQKVHRISRPSLACPLCTRRLYFRSRLLQHIAMHRNPDAFRCSICGEVHQDLAYHRKVKHHTKRLECPKCGKRFSVRNRLMVHLKIAHAPKDVECGVCHKLYSKYFIKTHMRAMHGGSEYVCELCGRTYRTVAMLNKHKAQHAEEPTESSIEQQQQQQRYIRRNLTSCKSFKCERCGKSFRSKATLNSHVERTCPSTQHLCSTCGKRFKTIGKLNEHAASHKDRVVYMCQLCLENFASKSQLFAHQQMVHELKLD
uniref:C2H2-type domain-containing protein n=1 Tax=Anopheles quadriannulatus TaxID=34691 RepID=A0A453Z3A3_ANOQN